MCVRCVPPGALAAAARERLRGVPDAHAGRAAHHAAGDPHYADVVAEVRAFLDERVAACRAAGIARERSC